MREQAFPVVALPKRHTSDLAAAALVGAAGALHLQLMPEHFQESVVFGIAFVGIALFQLGIASALVLHATPVVRTVGRWGSLAIVVTFLGARVVPPPGGNGLPERIEGPEGLLSVLLELGALAALTVILPMRPRAKSGFPFWTVSAIGAAYFSLQLIASGDVSYTQEPLWAAFSTRWYWYPDLSGFPNLSPAVTVLIAYHWYLYLPIVAVGLAAIVAVLLGVAVGLTIQLSRVRTHCSTRVGLLAAMPASLSAPVCCGPSLLSAAGVGLPALLGSFAVPLLGLSGALMLVDIGWLRRQVQSAGSATQPAR